MATQAQLAEALKSVARETLDARHIGPPADPNDPLQQLITSPLGGGEIQEVEPTPGFSGNTRSVTTSALREQVSIPAPAPAPANSYCGKPEPYVPEVKMVWQTKCEFCDWVSEVAHDGYAHLQRDEIDLSGSNRRVERELAAVTKVVSVPAQEGDREDGLHEARFFPTGLSWT